MATAEPRRGQQISVIGRQVAAIAAQGDRINESFENGELGGVLTDV